MRKSLLFLAFAMSGGSMTAWAQPPAPPAGPTIVVFISPMGEPFRRTQGPGEPVERWFQGADTDHDGAIGVTEFQADAARFFATLDVNHDGEIAPDEINRYETQVAPEVQTGIRMTTFGNANNRRLRLRPGEGLFGMGSQALLAIPEPVVSADADFNRGISPSEFRHAAGQRFLLIDRNHDGRITHDELSPPPVEDRRRR
jgi:Ca2+-binding EF-hand superfamily protein